MPLPRGIVRAVCAGIALAVVLLTAQLVSAQGQPMADKEALFRSIEWRPGPFQADLGTVGQIHVPAGYQFIAKKDMKKFKELTGNLPNDSELGAILPETHDWFIVFAFDNCGYVKDDEKDKLDADAILTGLKEGNKEGNVERKRRGMPSLNLVGWEKPPFYDPDTHYLTWATRLESQCQQDINYQTRLLGRGGVMQVVLAISPDQLDKTVPTFNQLLKGYTYKAGQKYSEWREGDKVAAYGLTGLIAGGAVIAAAKSGLLGKLLKPIIIGVVALFGAIAAFFKKLFGGRQRADTETQDNDNRLYNPFEENPPPG